MNYPSHPNEVPLALQPNYSNLNVNRAILLPIILKRRTQLECLPGLDGYSIYLKVHSTGIRLWVLNWGRLSILCTRLGFLDRTLDSLEPQVKVLAAYSTQCHTFELILIRFPAFFILATLLRFHNLSCRLSSGDARALHSHFISVVWHVSYIHTHSPNHAKAIQRQLFFFLEGILKHIAVEMCDLCKKNGIISCLSNFGWCQTSLKI